MQFKELRPAIDNDKPQLDRRLNERLDVILSGVFDMIRVQRNEAGCGYERVLPLLDLDTCRRQAGLSSRTSSAQCATEPEDGN